MNHKQQITNAKQISTMPDEKSIRNWLMMLGLLLALFFGQALVTKAAVYTVTKTTDTNDGFCNVDCSLREAIATARTAPGDDTVEFDSSLDGQTIVLTDEISIRSVNGEMNGAITINGLGANRLTIDGGEGLNRLFFFAMGTVTISDVTMTGGNGGGHFSGYGGAIVVSNLGTTLNLNRTRVTGNYSTNGGGGLIAGNSAEVNITDSTFDQNETVDPLVPVGTAFGGAIQVYSGTTLNLIRSRITGNYATGGGAAV